MLHYKIYSNLYKDSVSLMQVSSRLSGLEGVRQASVAMATDANLDRMRDAGMAITVAAKPSDLLIALLADEAVGEQALALADELLRPAPVDTPGAVGQRPATALAMGRSVTTTPTLPSSRYPVVTLPPKHSRHCTLA